MKNPNFWTDREQATERLTGTVVLYDNAPVYVGQVETHDDGFLRARLNVLPDRSTPAVRKRLDSPKFARYRDLPNIGWMNSADKKNPLFLIRRPVTTRSHGLCRANVILSTLVVNNDLSGVGQARSPFDDVIWDKGFVDAHNGSFPSLQGVLEKVSPGESAAVSRLFAVAHTADGIRWLYHNQDNIGLFTGVDTLLIKKKFSYLRETVMSSPELTINNIREF